MTKHYTEKDFVITEKDDYGKYGYCRKCKADMQKFNSDGILRHYHSHQNWKAIPVRMSLELLPRKTEIKNGGIK